MSDIPLVPSLWRFPAHPASVARARRAVAETLPHALRPHLGDDLGLLTSELLTNAIRYGARPEEDEVVELVLWPADGHYWLAVSDPGGGKPLLAHPTPDAETGRGLLLVDHLATHLDRPPPPHPRHLRHRRTPHPRVRSDRPPGPRPRPHKGAPPTRPARALVGRV